MLPTVHSLDLTPEVTAAYEDVESRSSGVVRLVCANETFGPQCIERLLSAPELAAAYRGETPALELVLDLKCCTFVEPFGATVLRSLCDAIRGRVARVWIVLPGDPDVRSYFTVVGLADGLPDHVSLVGRRSGDPTGPSNSEMLLPVRAIRSETDAEEVYVVARDRLHRLLAQIGWPAAVAARALGALKEITMNVVEHAGHPGYIAFQAYRLAGPEPFLVLALSDAGVGIRANLEGKYPRLKSLRDAQVLGALFDQNLTSRPGVRRGHGMATLRDAVRTANGRLTLRSGMGAYHEQPGKGPWLLRRFWLPGTHVRLSFDAPRS